VRTVMTRLMFAVAVAFAFAAALTALVAAVQAPGAAQQQRTFEGQPAVVLSNDKLEATITTLGSTLASIVVADDPD
jgi:hypothetical protein